MVRVEFPTDPVGWAALGWIPPGWCECGCGRRTTVAPQSHRRWGYVKGVPLRFARGHRAVNRGYGEDHWIPNPTGLCLCNCGQRTRIATRNNRRVGHRKGEHVLYLPGHNPGGLRGEGSLYFIGSEDGPIKVGWTKEVPRRLREISTANWLPISVYGTIVGTSELEALAHDQLAEHCVRGEWFERDAALSLLAELVSTRTTADR